MQLKVMVHDCVSGESYERNMTAEEIAQAELDEKTPKQWQSDDLAN